MQPIAAKQPYMVAMGNHESIYDGLNYRKRFTMPFFNATHNLWYSYDHGNTHWLSYTSEAYFEVTDRRYPELGREHWGPWPEWVAAQREFIQSDLGWYVTGVDCTKPSRNSTRQDRVRRTVNEFLALCVKYSCKKQMNASESEVI